MSTKILKITSTVAFLCCFGCNHVALSMHRLDDDINKGTKSSPKIGREKLKVSSDIAESVTSAKDLMKEVSKNPKIKKIQLTVVGTQVETKKEKTFNSNFNVFKDKSEDTKSDISVDTKNSGKSSNTQHNSNNRTGETRREENGHSTNVNGNGGFWGGYASVDVGHSRHNNLFIKGPNASNSSGRSNSKSHNNSNSNRQSNSVQRTDITKKIGSTSKSNTATSSIVGPSVSTTIERRK